MRKLIEYTKRLVDKYKNAKRKYQVLLPVSLALLVAYIACLPEPLFDVPYSTVVSDKNSELLGARIASDEQWRFPTSDSIPEKYKICLMAFEDRHFYYHWGINPLAIARAAKQNIGSKRIVSGASTITMQTIRLSRKEKRTYFEKVIEVILATRLEFSCSKDEILRLYASHAPMGGNVVGIDAASWRYFAHKSANLSWAEAATLAILPNSPALIHFGKNRDKLKTKRNNLLKYLHEQGEMDEVDYNLAISEPLPPHPYPLPMTAPHLVARIAQDESGKAVTTTINKYQQQSIEIIVNRWNAEFIQNDVRNLAALVIDVEKNEVLAYCGNVNFERNTTGNQVDIIQARRSTGSLLKPFLYCAMQQEGLMLPDELLPDVPINVNGFAPKNFSLMYDGAAHASSALARSLNVPSVVSLRKYSVPKLHNLLMRSGMTTLGYSSDHYGLSMILGGCEGKMWEMANMYAMLAQSVNEFNKDGKMYLHEPAKYIVSKDTQRKEEGIPIYQPGAAWITLQALSKVNRPEEIDWRSIPSIQKIGWKTGTSFGGRDAWSIGVTPKYVVAVWVGNANGEGRPGLTGARSAGRVMFDIFNVLPSSLWFKAPREDLIQVETCKESGLLRGLNCDDESVELKWISKRGKDSESCHYHQLVHLSEDMKYQVYNDCAGVRGIIHRSWFILPPRWEWYYKQTNHNYKTLPPYSPECRSTKDATIMELIYPFPNAILSIPKQLNGTEGEIVFELAHKKPERKVFWHINDEYIGETRDIHKLGYKPTKGKKKLVAVDEFGESISLSFSVR